MDGTAINPDNTWPPLGDPMNASVDWPNSIRKQATNSNVNEWVNNMSPGAILGRIKPELSIGADQLGCGVPVLSTSGNQFVVAAITSLRTLGNQSGKRKTRKGVIPRLCHYC